MLRRKSRKGFVTSLFTILSYNGIRNFSKLDFLKFLIFQTKPRFPWISSVHSLSLYLSKVLTVNGVLLWYKVTLHSNEPGGWLSTLRFLSLFSSSTNDCPSPGNNKAVLLSSYTTSLLSWTYIIIQKRFRVFTFWPWKFVKTMILPPE